MIPCRLLIRVDRVWRSPCVAAALSNPLCSYQSCFHDRALSRVMNMGGAKDGSNAIDRYKKRKAAVPLWKPVSTNSASLEGCSGRDLKTDPEAVNYNEESDAGVPVHEMASSCISIGQNLTQDEPMADSIVSSLTIANDKEQQSNSFTCDMEHLSESGGGRVSSEVLDQELIIEEMVPDLGSGKKAESTNWVEKYSVSVQVKQDFGKFLPVADVAIDRVDASLIRFVKGKGGCTQRQIEGETGVKIIFPTSKEDTVIVIEGSSLESLTVASRKIETAIEQAVKSPSVDYSHFISLPLAIHPELTAKLYNFQNSILGEAISSQEGDLESHSNEDASDGREDENNKLENPNIAVKLEVQDDREQVRVKIGSVDTNIDASKPSSASILSDLGIDKSIFIKPKTFHLTVLMLKLWNKDRITAAYEVLQGISSKVMDALDNRPVSIRLKGLELMRGSPVKARVLYAPVEEIGGEGRLLRACQVITEAYVTAGLVLEKDARQPLKDFDSTVSFVEDEQHPSESCFVFTANSLDQYMGTQELHATLMNARHRTRKNWNRRHDSFDARGIFRRFGSEEWGDYLIREAHLSQRFLFDESGYYHCCASIPFPENMQIE